MTTAAESASKHSLTGGVGSSDSVAGPSAGSPAGPSMSAEPQPVCEAAALCGRQLAAGRSSWVRTAFSKAEQLSCSNS